MHARTLFFDMSFGFWGFAACAARLFASNILSGVLYNTATVPLPTAHLHYCAARGLLSTYKTFSLLGILLRSPECTHIAMAALIYQRPLRRP